MSVVLSHHPYSEINRKAIALKKKIVQNIFIYIFFPGFAVDTCGPPKIQNTMMNQTVVPGEFAHFKCQVFNDHDEGDEEEQNDNDDDDW